MKTKKDRYLSEEQYGALFDVESRRGRAQIHIHYDLVTEDFGGRMAYWHKPLLSKQDHHQNLFWKVLCSKVIM